LNSLVSYEYNYKYKAFNFSCNYKRTNYLLARLCVFLQNFLILPRATLHLFFS